VSTSPRGNCDAFCWIPRLFMRILQVYKTDNPVSRGGDGNSIVVTDQFQTCSHMSSFVVLMLYELAVLHNVNIRNQSS
jgi:hypothetical protein